MQRSSCMCMIGSDGSSLVLGMKSLFLGFPAYIVCTILLFLLHSSVNTMCLLSCVFLFIHTALVDDVCIELLALQTSIKPVLFHHISNKHAYIGPTLAQLHWTDTGPITLDRRWPNACSYDGTTWHANVGSPLFCSLGLQWLNPWQPTICQRSANVGPM